MKILLAVVAASEHLSGVSRHAANMARCLLTRADVSSVDLVVAAWQYDALCGALPQDDPRLHIHQVNLGSSNIARNLWYYNHLPKLAAQLNADIVHLAYPSPVKRRAFRCPVVVTLHDLYPYDIPANFGFPKVLFNRIILQQCLRAVDAIACVSESTLRRLDIYAPRLALQKAVTIFNCVEAGPPMSAQSPLPLGSTRPFLLCVAQHRRNKNILLAMGAFRHLLLSEEIDANSLLVIIGIEGPETPRIHRYIHESGLSHHIVLLRGVDDAGLQWCYGHCALLLAPSIVEGFGLPVVEGMLQHCRIVCSDIPVFREIGGSYCYYASLDAPAESAFVNAARNALRNIKFRAAETHRFAAPRIAASYLRLYHHLRNGGLVAGNCNHSELVSFLEREGDRERLI